MHHVGSTWRKWDLHVHSPFSHTHHYGPPTPENLEKFIRDLESLPPEFKVIGINDYLTVKGYEYVRDQKRNHNRLQNIDLILPVVELRLSMFGGVQKVDGSTSALSRVNYHVIFDALDPRIIEVHFLHGLSREYILTPNFAEKKGTFNDITTAENLRRLGELVINSVPEAERHKFGPPEVEGFNNVNFELKAISDLLEKDTLKDKHLLAVGKTEWADIKWNDNTIAAKKTLINKANLVFVAAENPEKYKSARESLINGGVNSNLLDCSDAHSYSDVDIKDRIGNCFTWIKADATFLGLKHAVEEFDQRVFVGDDPPKRYLVRSNATKYISTIEIRGETGQTKTPAWFDIEIPLNYDLVAIIGNKGTGKSALADTIALLGDTRNSANFSFLTNDRFCGPKAYAKHFRGTITWKDDNKDSKLLNEKVSHTTAERVKYLPQRFIDQLCNELATGASSDFDDELRKIIFTHVPDEQRQGYQSLQSLLDYKLSAANKVQSGKRERLAALNQAIISMEERMTAEFREQLSGLLATKRRERDALLQAKPEEVKDPSESEDVQKSSSDLAQGITVAEKELAESKTEEDRLKQVRAAIIQRLNAMKLIIDSVRSQQMQFAEFRKAIEGHLKDAELAIPVESIIDLRVDLKAIEGAATALQVESTDIAKKLSDPGEQGFRRRQDGLIQLIAQLKGQLGEPQRLFMNYLEQLKIWAEAIRVLDGTAQQENSIAYYVAQIEELDQLPEKYANLREQRLNMVREIHAHQREMMDQYRALYEAVQKFVKEQKDAGSPIDLDFKVKIVDKGFRDNFTSMINRQVRGSFSGISESDSLLDQWAKETEFDASDSVCSFVDRVERALHLDIRFEEARPIKISEQLRSGATVNSVYDYIYGLSYLEPKYSLTYGGEELHLLSPGERGLLLLVFYLLVDKSDVPLIIDQPEENLDNQTIYKVLGQCIIQAKNRRQVIMVTHNPNLAVACDAEQIIYAARQRGVSQFTYESGPIEDPRIKAYIVEVLEGTKPAFENRSKKYLVQ